MKHAKSYQSIEDPHAEEDFRQATIEDEICQSYRQWQRDMMETYSLSLNELNSIVRTIW